MIDDILPLVTDGNGILNEIKFNEIELPNLIEFGRILKNYGWIRIDTL